MKNLNNILTVCYLYKQGKLCIEEFQSRIVTAAIPDNISKEFVEELAYFDSKIEENTFCYLEAEQQILATILADRLIRAVLAEQKRLEDN